jgi:sugar phosphate isomerase/epimerase
MKLAYMLATPDVASFPLCWMGDLAHVIGRVSAIGYDGVEVQVRDPALVDRSNLARLTGDAGIKVCGIGTGQIGAEDKLFLTSPDADVRARAVDRFKAVLDLAAEFGVDASIGRFRGLASWAPDRATGIGWFRSALEALLPHAEQVGARILLEPQMRFNTDFLNSFQETIALIDSLGSPALKFEGDLFHMAMEERSIPASFVTGLRSGHLVYVQLGDTNRLAPGWGHLNWVDVIETLRAGGYDGWLTMEFTQKPDSDTCAQHAYSFVRPLLEAQP